MIACDVYLSLLFPARVYRSQARLKSEYQLKFHDDGIEIHTDQLDSHLKWSFYHSWLCDDEFFIMYHNEHGISVLPRRSFSESDNKRLAELLQQKIGPAIS